jgi:hypothetical protein
MRKLFLTVLALLLAGFSGTASAQTEACQLPVGSISSDTTWTKAGSPYILPGACFVEDGATLTIQPGVIVRGQPRQSTPTPGTIAGTPGSLIVTAEGKIQAVGTPAEPIIFTTAAIDNDDDNVPDDCGGVLCAWEAGDTFYDDDPANSPIAPLSAAGLPNVGMWGGVAVLGNAPTNLGNQYGNGQGIGQVEGLVIPGFPVARALYGGVNPHDDSGSLKYVSIRNAGDEIEEANELNCLTLAGVGDATEISYVECQSNWDDGFEWFGGTVGADHLASYWIGDDSFDLDQGYTGIGQFWHAIQTTFNADNGSSFGSGSGDRAGEWDGEDFGERGGDVNYRTEGTQQRPWPQSNPLVYNLTVQGTSSPGTNPATSPAGDNRGVFMRNGYAGALWNAIIVNTGTQECFEVEASGAANFTAADNAAAGSLVVGTTTCDGTAGISGAAETAATNGDAERCARGALPCAQTPTAAHFQSENIIEGSSWSTSTAAAFAGLAQDVTAVEPKGDGANKIALGMLSPSAGGPIDPRPVGAVGVAGAVIPSPAGTVDSAATYRGAFPAGVSPWTGFTSLSVGGILLP